MEPISLINTKSTIKCCYVFTIKSCYVFIVCRINGRLIYKLVCSGGEGHFRIFGNRRNLDQAPPQNPSFVPELASFSRALAIFRRISLRPYIWCFGLKSRKKFSKIFLSVLLLPITFEPKTLAISIKKNRKAQIQTVRMSHIKKRLRESFGNESTRHLFGATFFRHFFDIFCVSVFVL